MAKQGLSITELAQQLQAAATERQDYIAPQGKIEARPIVTAERADIVIDGLKGLDPIYGEGKPLTDHAHGQLATALQIPKPYYDRMRATQPGLLADNVNTWLDADPNNKRMLRTLGGKIRAVLSPKYRPLDNFELASAVLPKLIGMNTQVVSSALTETRMYLKVILPDLCDDLPDGLVWGTGHNRVAEYGSNQAGKLVAALTISNSEVGAGSLRVEPSVFTTWCTNLMAMSEASMRKYHVGRSNEVGEDMSIFRDETREADDKAFFMRVSDVVEHAFKRETFEAAIAQIRDAGNAKIGSQDLTKVVEKTVKTLSLPVSTQGSILTYMAQGGDLSKWGLASAITATANNFGDYEGATELERAGGKLLALEEGKWEAIASAA